MGTAYALAALREETRRIAIARPGTRNDTLNRAGFSLGQLVAAGLLPPAAVITALASAAGRAGAARGRGPSHHPLGDGRRGEEAQRIGLDR